MEEIIIRKGNYINGEKVIGISFDPFIKGQFNIWVDKYEDIGFGDKAQKVYRISIKEKNNGSIL